MTSPLQAAARALVLAQSEADIFDDLEPEAQEQAIETVRAVLAAQWQPIATAPKDQFVLLYEDGAMRCGLWEGGKWVPAEIPVLIDSVGNRIVSRELEQLRGERLELSGFLYEPTHWMPLPEAPE